ncbi:MAG: DNA-processing protein DprA [Betaproteobacteria bacterium]|nr:DNA-processing protein DprA [Betaproteobacteria bacterium]
MALDTHLEPWLRLALIPGLGATALRGLLLAFGAPDKILGASRAALARHVPDPVARAICDGGAADALPGVRAWLDDPLNRIITLADPVYPQILLQISDPPPLIYAKGRAELLANPAFAVVGSRHATPQGVAIAESFARTLSDAGLSIVSGLALGIDAAAHRGGLAGRASSIAVLGTGLDIVYPARNRVLAHALAGEGLLLSEFALGTPALGANFPRRNRVISGLARGCLVVEAAPASGSLITARLANEQGREVFAVPGSIHSPQSKGCHLLIKQGAKLTESAQDILEELSLPPAAAPVGSPEPNDDRKLQALLEHLGFDPCDIDTLAARCGLSSAAVTALLSQLEIDGLVAALPGGRFQRVR